MSSFRNVLQLSAGDFVARTISFLAFVYAARVLGVDRYGVLEFALAVMTYLLLMADGGLELWATRAAAQGEDIPALAGRVVALRLFLASVVYVALAALIPLLPDYPSLRALLLLFGLTLFAQAVNLKWVFMGREKLSDVAVGLMGSQLVFAVALLVAVHSTSSLVWIPIVRLVSDGVMAVHFAKLYRRGYVWSGLTWSFAESRRILRRAVVLGAAHGLAQVSYNFDSVLLGLLSSSAAVGWYGAAYRPINAVLALPVTYFLGLFPVLSRTFRGNPPEFQAIMRRSLRMLAVFAMPVALGGTFWAKPVIGLLFGPDYAQAVLPLQILSWSAALVILRGTYRQALNASGRQDLDFRCAWIATGINVALNLLLIPFFSIVGAAVATLTAEVIWLAVVSVTVHRKVTPVPLAALVRVPAQAAALAAASVWLSQPLWWVAQIAIAAAIYVLALAWMKEREPGSGQAGKMQTVL